MGIFFTLLLFFIGYVWFFDVWQIRSGLTVLLSNVEIQDMVTGGGGVSTASLPEDVFSEERVSCYIGVLGQERVDEISAGSTPTPVEMLSLAPCLEE